MSDLYIPINIQLSLAFLEAHGFKTDGFIESWTEPQRVYHGLDHIEWMLESIYKQEYFYGVGAFDMRRLHLAAWYHDIVYVPGNKDNEWESATRAILDLSPRKELAFQVADDVMATKTHERTGDLNTALLIDADLHGLGSDNFIYMKNSDKVKAEYVGITDEQWFTRRAAFLEGFLAREEIFLTQWGKQFEEAARVNMQLELEHVRGQMT